MASESCISGRLYSWWGRPEMMDKLELFVLFAVLLALAAYILPPSSGDDEGDDDDE